MTTLSVTERPSAEHISAADRFMLRLLRISATDRSKAAGAHRAFRASILVTAVRYLVTYVVLPVLAPVVTLAGVLATPLGIALGAVALISGTISLRRFWVSDHRGKWMYTVFIVVVFAIVVVALTMDLTRLAVGA